VLVGATVRLGGDDTDGLAVGGKEIVGVKLIDGDEVHKPIFILPLRRPMDPLVGIYPVTSSFKTKA
jgi:hypothetical protein